MALFGEMLSPGEIIDRIVQVEGAYERVLGKLKDLVLFDKKVESDFYIVDKIYWLSNIRECLPKVLSKKDFRYMSDTIFRFSTEAANKAAIASPAK